MWDLTRANDDSMIDWNKSTLEIHNLIRGLSQPGLGAYTYYKGKRLYIWSAKPVLTSLNYIGRLSGKIVNISMNNKTVDVLTGDKALRIFEVQLEDDCKKAATEVINSIRYELGLNLETIYKRILQLEEKMENMIEANEIKYKRVE